MSAAINDSSVPRMTSRFRFQWEEAQQAYVILYPEGMIKLNASAGEILKRCNGTSTVGTIIEDLIQQFPGAAVAADVRKFLEIASDNGWICY